MDKELGLECPPIYYEKLMELHKFFTFKYTSLEETINSCYRKILNDQILSTMVKDTTTVNYIEERVRELFKEIVENEREILIEKLGIKCNDLTFKCKQLENSLAQSRKHIDVLESKTLKERDFVENEKSGIHAQLRKRESELEDLKFQLRDKSYELSAKDKSCQELEERVAAMKEENLKIRQSFEKRQEEIEDLFEEQNKQYQLKDFDLKESTKKVLLLQNSLKQIEQVNHEKVDALEKKCRKKVAEYKSKIEEYKSKIMELIKNQKERQPEENYEYKAIELSKKLSLVTRESERKINDLKSSIEKERLSMERKYESKYKELQNYYDKLLEEKISESEKEVEDAAERIREQEDEIRKYVEFLEQNSVPLEEMSKLQAYYQNLKQHLEVRIVEYEKNTAALAEENKQLGLFAQQTQKNEELLLDKISDLQQSGIQVRNKVKNLQNQISILKSSEKKMKAILADSQNLINEKQDEAMMLRNQLQKLRAENTELLSVVNEKENLIHLKISQSQMLDKKAVKLEKQKRELQEELQKTESMMGNSKKYLTEKENSIQTITQDSQFKIEALNAQLHKSSLTLEVYTEKMREMGEKNSGLESEVSLLRKEKMEIQSLLRKIELENKYVKESEQSLREQHETYVSDFKRKSQEKSLKLEQIENRLNESKKEQALQSSASEQKQRKLMQTIKKVVKVYSIEIDNLTRYLRDIRVQVESSSKLMQSEVKILESNANLKIKEHMYVLLNQKNEQIRRMKQSLQHEKNQEMEANKSKIDKQESLLKERAEMEMRNFENELVGKEKEIDRLEKEKRRLLADREEMQEKVIALERKTQDYQMSMQNEKLQSKSKLNEMQMGFDLEKDRIISELGAKRDRQEEEMADLVEKNKSLRKQIESLKNLNEQYKQKWGYFESLSGEEGKRCKNISQIKNSEIVGLNEEIKQLKQNTSKLEKQIRELIQMNKQLNLNLNEFELKNEDVSGQLLIVQTKVDRLNEENESLISDIKFKQQERASFEQCKLKLESELKQLKQAISKSNKSHEPKALQQLDVETRELSNKVNQLRKVSLIMNTERSPLRF